MRMAYIGAETPNDSLSALDSKGDAIGSDLWRLRSCAGRTAVIPELSFMVAPPEDPENETEKNVRLSFGRPSASTRTPRSSCTSTRRCRRPACRAFRAPEPHAARRRLTAAAVQFPTTPRGLDREGMGRLCLPRRCALVDGSALRRRIRDFVTVLQVPIPDRSGYAIARLGQGRPPRPRELAIRDRQRYDRPWELTASHRLIGLVDPQGSRASEAGHVAAVRVTQISFYVDPERRYAGRDCSTTGLTLSTHALTPIKTTAGTSVSVIQAKHDYAGRVERAGVVYEFLSPGRSRPTPDEK